MIARGGCSNNNNNSNNNSNNNIFSFYSLFVKPKISVEGFADGSEWPVDDGTVGALDSHGALKDHPMTDHGEFLGLLDPFQNGRFMADIHGGDPNHLQALG